MLSYNPGMPTDVTQDRSLPLRERKKLRTRRALADAALRLFTEKGFDATTLEELADDAEVSKSTFSRTFPAKEAAGIEAEAELWTAYLTALEDGKLSGPVLAELHRTLAAAAAEQGRVRDIHDVRVRETSGGVFVLFHCRVDPETPVETVHDAVDSLERSVRQAFPEARRVVSHAEPEGAEAGG